MWRRQAHDLAELRHVVAVDLSGHGANRDQPPSHTVDDMARQLVELLDSQGIDKVDLGGFSMGGYVCFAFWRMYSDRVRSLLLVDTRAGADSPEGRQGRDSMAADVTARGAVVAADAMVPKLLSPAAPPRLVEEVRGWILELPPETIVADLMAMRDRPDSTPILAAIDVPTLVVVGSEDVLTPPSESVAMAKAIPQARLQTITGAGHLSPVEQPDAVSGALSAFLGSVDT
jgi:pimeloyl-ACP methyl ester carboxylesterase